MLERQRLTISFSPGSPLFCRRGRIQIFVHLKQISPFPNNFGTYQGPRKQGAGIGKNCGLMKMIRAPGADPRARPGAELAFHCAADTRTSQCRNHITQCLLTRFCSETQQHPLQPGGQCPSLPVSSGKSISSLMSKYGLISQFCSVKCCEDGS